MMGQWQAQKHSKYSHGNLYTLRFSGLKTKSYTLRWNCNRVCFTRCVLAADCLEAVRQCISSIQYRLDDDCSTKSIVAVRLRASLRKCVSPALSHSFVSLGEILEDSLIHQRLKKFSDTSATKPPSSLLNGASPSKLEFELWERRLW